MRIWQAGKSREARHIVDPIATATGNALKIGNECFLFVGAKSTGLYSGIATLEGGQEIKYTWDSTGVARTA